MAFVRTRGGSFTTFDAPKAGTADGQGTVANSINRAGTVAGVYVDRKYVQHGLVRLSDGTIESFDPSGSTSTFAASINASGAITGYWRDSRGAAHGFVRSN